MASDVPGAGASPGDVRFWAYNKFGAHFEEITALTKTSNYLVDKVKQLETRLNDQPTYNETADWANGCVEEHLKIFKKDIIDALVDRPNFNETKAFVQQMAAEGYDAATRAAGAGSGDRFFARHGGRRGRRQVLPCFRLAVFALDDIR